MQQKKIECMNAIINYMEEPQKLSIDVLHRVIVLRQKIKKSEMQFAEIVAGIKSLTIKRTLPKDLTRVVVDYYAPPIIEYKEYIDSLPFCHGNREIDKVMNCPPLMASGGCLPNHQYCTQPTKVFCWDTKKLITCDMQSTDELERKHGILAHDVRTIYHNYLGWQNCAYINHDCRRRGEKEILESRRPSSQRAFEAVLSIFHQRSE